MNAPACPSAVWPYLLLNAAAAAWLDFTRLHELQTADSLVFSLSALYEWRPFFWEQDRVGSLWPLLLSWCRHPLVVLLLHTWITTFLGLSMPVLLARVLTPNRAGPVVATLGNAAVLWLAPPVILGNWLIECNYPAALALGFAAVLIAEGERRFAVRALTATVLLVAAHWLYLGVVPFLVPLVVYRAWRRDRAGSRWRALLLTLVNRPAAIILTGTPVAVGIVFGLMERTRRTDPHIDVMPSGTLNPDRWPEVYAEFPRRLFGDPGVPELTALFGGVFAVGLLVGLVRFRSAVRVEAVRVVPAVLAALGEYAFLGTRTWVSWNGCHPRYLVAVGTTACLGVLLVGLAPMLERLPRTWFRWLTVAAGVLLFASATARFGPPAPSTPLRTINERFGASTSDVLLADVDGVGGSYWRVWQTVFHVNLSQHRVGRPVVWGIGQRCGPWQHRWTAEPGRVYRVAVFTAYDLRNGKSGMDEFLESCERYGLTLLQLEPVERRGEVAVYLVAATNGERPGLPRP